MEFRDYYQTLGVDRNATADEIRKAFRKLARKFHPDVSKAPDADERMKEVNEAYAVLGDAEKRAAYDQLGQGYASGQDFAPPPGWDDGFEWSGRQFHARDAGEFSDFFAELFGRMGHGGPGRPERHQFDGRGEDQRGEHETRARRSPLHARPGARGLDAGSQVGHVGGSRRRRGCTANAGPLGAGPRASGDLWGPACIGARWTDP